MVEILQRLCDGYSRLLEYRDPRTKDWFLVSGPALPLILAGYLYFCFKVGPSFMKNRKPLELKRTLILYNAFQISICTFLVFEGLSALWRGEYNLICQPLDYSYSTAAVRNVAALWWYYIAKITQLLDTVFFILRKKGDQITALHLYHHTSMPLVAWTFLQYCGGGHASLCGAVNCFVHIIMYSYYLIAGLGPEYKKYLWWKQHLTLLQLVQFLIICVHNLQALFSDCKYPKLLNILLMGESVIFLAMFSSFYYKSYVNNSKGKVKQHAAIKEKKRM